MHFRKPGFAAGLSDLYEVGGDPTVSHGSGNPGHIRSIVPKIDGSGSYMTTMASETYKGNGLKLSAYVRTANTQSCGLWMLVEGSGYVRLSFDDMVGQRITGTTDWKQYEVVLDVPESSTGISYGIKLTGTGEAWVDGLRLEPVARTWIIQNSGISEYIHSVKAVDENVVWAGAQHGVFLRTTDGGSNWTSDTVKGAEQLNFFSIAAIDKDTAYFVAQNFNGGDGRIYKTSDGGISWKLQYQNTDPGAFLDCIAFWDHSRGIAVGDPVSGSFVIVTTTNGGANWNQVPAANIPPPLPGEFGLTTEGGTCLAVEGTKNAWFGTGNASPVRVLRSTDQGQTWTAVNTPISTAGTMLHGIQTIVFKDSLNGFAGGVDYPYRDSATTLVKTTDGGKSWTGVASFLPICPSTLVYVPHTNNSMLFVTSLQGCGYSNDGGASPSSTQL